MLRLKDNTLNKKYSHKDFTGKIFINLDPSEFNDSEIVGSCFYQETGKPVMIFPKGSKNIIFRGCNLDNVRLPADSRLYECSNNHIKKVQDLQTGEVKDLIFSDLRIMEKM